MDPVSYLRPRNALSDQVTICRSCEYYTRPKRTHPGLTILQVEDDTYPADSGTGGFMNKAILAIVIACLGTSAFAQVRVRGHFRKDGTYVAPHVRTKPNNTRSDNWSTRGNVNPYTGEAGTQSPDRPAGSTYEPYRSNNEKPN